LDWQRLRESRSHERAAFWMNMQARFDLETAEDLLAPQIKKIASYEA
jgi:plasmid maintenance system antidote protein VapI